MDDASIHTAARRARITKIHHIDYRHENILGLISTFTITVYGEGEDASITRADSRSKKRVDRNHFQ